MKTALKIINVSLQKNSHPRLENINISINEGEKVALVGKSGSGKTTLLNVVNGTLMPTSGKVIYNGCNITRLSRKQKSKIGTIWQDLRLIDELSVIQNVNCGALGRHNFAWAISNLVSSINQKECALCLELAELPETYINKNVKALSAGQRTRVAIAKLISQKPSLMLADEPLSALDPKLAENILTTLLKEKEFESFSIPSTSIITLHQTKFISHFNRVIGIRNGSIFFDSKDKLPNKTMLLALYQ